MKFISKIKEATKGAKEIGDVIKEGYDRVKKDPDMTKEYNKRSEEICSQSALEKMLCKADNLVFRSETAYLKEKYNALDVQPDESHLNGIACVEITKWVYNKEESIIDKLKNIYTAFSGSSCRVSVVIKRSKEGSKIYMLACGRSKDGNEHLRKRLISLIDGNFPGAEINEITFGGKELKDSVNVGDFYSNFLEFAEKTNTEENKCDIKIKEAYNVAAVTNIASEKSEKYITQGIEKLLDGIIPSGEKENYCIILLGEALSGENIDLLKEQLHNIYTGISPYASRQKNISIANSNFNSFNASMNVGLGVGLANTVGSTSQKGETFTFTNHKVQHILNQVDSQMKRVETFESLGLWNFATYIVSEDYTTTENVAKMYCALTQGETSNFEKPVVNVWRADQKEQENTKSILKCLACMEHPVFELKDDKDAFEYPLYTKATTYISGIELAHAMNFPRKSVAGFPVIECTEFGRNIVSDDSKYEGTIRLGDLYHMHKVFSTEVSLNEDSFTSHVFVTGSTGAGKSNTVFQILKGLMEKGKKVLVIEPAKGEYKHVFGDGQVKVYGTNPKKSKLLRINPFFFPPNILVTEHIDRIVEIFNVCWPMYAAMPAILKDAIIRAYESCGWNLETSTNEYNDVLFPSFTDVLNEIRRVLLESEYSADTKGDYTGALVERVKSLTNGINGSIFSNNGLSNSELFEENVIVDLSRVGSIETKSLIMGMLVIQLQEYRLSEDLSEELKHVTVLEEAHNLLRRTSMEQSSESANLLGKSVEMIANSIAEMRAFGEGFIIADQAPGLLDMSVIRNTNTKIIHRLPDFSDRQLVGRAAGLNDEQINELAKLKVGVAAVYQNGWILPVLCKVDEFKDKAKYHQTSDDYQLNNVNECKKIIFDIITKPNEYIEFDEEKVLMSKLPSKVKALLFEYLSKESHSDDDRIVLAYETYGNKESLYQSTKNTETGFEMMENELKSIGVNEEIKLLMGLIVQGYAKTDKKYENLIKDCCEYLKK